MGWMIVWLGCAMLASHEIGGLAGRPGVGPALAIVYGVGALVGLFMLLRRAFRRARPAQLYPALAIGLLGAVLSMLGVQQRLVPPAWGGTFVAAAFLLTASSGVILFGAILVWRRRERLRDRHDRQVQASERQRLLERTTSGALLQVVEELENPPIEDDADLLPPRPPRPPRFQRRKGA